jgi:hypothetical protein
MVKREGMEDWVSNSKMAQRPLFSELDVLLRALDRFFNIENLTYSTEDLTVKNFQDELITARDAILRILAVLEVVIPESRKNAYWFQKFTETKFLTTRRRDAFRENLYKQDTPEKGLYLLYDSFINMKGIISDLIRTGSISYMGFTNIGHMISKDIRENNYFNPFGRELDPEYDVISHPVISEIVKSIKQRDVRKHISIIYIYLYRFVRYMSFIDITLQRTVSLNCSLITLILLRAEIRSLQGYIEKAIRKVQNPEMEMLLKAIAYGFSMETRRVFFQELKDIHRKKASPQFRGKIENSYGILKNLTEQSIVQMTQFFRPEIKGEEIFSSFVTKVEQSVRLREDVYVLHRLLLLLESKAGKPAVRFKVFESLRKYMLYFEGFTYRLLRHDDYEEFFLFFNEINSVRKEQVQAADFSKIMERVAHFKIYLETTLRHIANRAELSDRPLDMEKVQALLKEYV